MSGEKTETTSTDVARGGASLPSRLRWITIATVMFTTMVGFFGAGEVSGLVREQTAADLVLPDRALFGLKADPELTRVAVEAHDAGLAAMKSPRVVTLSLLTFSCVFASVAALRLLFPRGLARGAMRQAMVGALFSAALLRTIDGAQWAVVCRRIGKALSGELAKRGQQALGPDAAAAQDPQAFAALVEHLPMLMAVSVGIGTALVAGLFLVLAQYFRSPGVKEAIDTADVFGASR